MPRNVVSGEFTRVVQRVPVRIWIERDDRWPMLRAGLSARVAIAHGEGDPAWAAKAARELAGVRDPLQPPAAARPADDRREAVEAMTATAAPPVAGDARAGRRSAGATSWRRWRSSWSWSRSTRPSS